MGLQAFPWSFLAVKVSVIELFDSQGHQAVSSRAQRYAIKKLPAMAYCSLHVHRRMHETARAERVLGQGQKKREV